MARSRVAKFCNLPIPAGLFIPDNIKVRTAEFRAALGQVAEPELTPEQQRLQQIANLCQSRFDCHAQQTRELVQLILQTELPPATTTSAESRKTINPWVPGALVRYESSLALISNTDSDGDAVYFIVLQGLTRECYIGAFTVVTAATDAEIDDWVKLAGLVA